MKIRKGDYAMYRGSHFPLHSTEDGKWKIISTDPSSAKNGFEQCGKGTFCLEMDQKSIESAYSVKTRARYKGFEFSLDKDPNSDKFRLWLDLLDHDAYKSFGFNLRDEYAHLLVEGGDIEEVWEERKPLIDFPFEVENKVNLKID